ncbi:MAG: purine-nucleoside phosphorylase [Nannocystaceae bacterium]
MEATHESPAQRATEVLRARLGGETLDWALICGSGIGKGMVREGSGLGLEVEWTLPLAELGLPVPSVAGHGNALVFGRIGDQRVCVQTGRLHPYEGHSIATCTAALQAMLSCGARGVALTCAAGGVNPVLSPGELAILRDHINLFGPTALVGPRFVPSGEVYAGHLRARLHVRADALRLGRDGHLREVVYMHLRGPQYETPAETEALRRLGSDIVGMSTTYEAILALAEGAQVCAVAVVTNVAGVVGLSHEEVHERSDAALPSLAGLLGGVLAVDPRP